LSYCVLLYEIIVFQCITPVVSC